MSTLESRLKKAKEELEKAEKAANEIDPVRRLIANNNTSSKAAVRYAKEKALLKKLKDTRATVGRLETKIHNKKGGRTRRSKRGSKKTRRIL
jgi:uncharacterized iron-regulated protein